MYEHVRLILACVFVHVCVLCVCQLALVKRAWAKVRAEQHMRVFVCVCVRHVSSSKHHCIVRDTWSFFSIRIHNVRVQWQHG
jgi:hypothetical protein